MTVCYHGFAEYLLGRELAHGASVVVDLSYREVMTIPPETSEG